MGGDGSGRSGEAGEFLASLDHVSLNCSSIAIAVVVRIKSLSALCNKGGREDEILAHY